jgi:hypothetical protein
VSAIEDGLSAADPSPVCPPAPPPLPSLGELLLDEQAPEAASTSAITR